MTASAEEMEKLRQRPTRRPIWTVLAVIVVAVALVGVAFAAGWFGGGPAKITILGAGATFPCPLLTKWSSEYANVSSQRVTVNYNCVGSGAGITQITQKTVDFGASDAPLKPSERAAAPGLIHLPETIGAVTAAYNVPSLSSGLNLTGHVLGEIFLGKITTWNSPNITDLNPGVTFPSSTITVVHRSDSSGTSFVWTSYLHLENPGWNSALVGKSINWPVGVGASGNSGVAGKIQTTPDSIGYVELAYTVQNSMKVAKVRNPAGNWILPTLASTAAAAASLATPPSPAGDWNNVSILNSPGENSYPVASLTYLLVYKELNTIGSSMTQTKAQALRDFLWWAVHDGQNLSEGLVYPKLPAGLVTVDEEAIQSLTFNGQTLHS